MTNSNNLKNNIIYNILYQILSIIVPLITAPYISRVLGKEGMGIYSYAYSISHYFVLFCMLGILNYGNREIAMVNNDTYKCSNNFWHIYSIQFIAGILSLTIYLLFVFSFVYDNQFIFYIQSLYIISGILDISWFYFGIERFKTTTLISSFNKVFTTILIFLLVKTSNDVWIYTIILATGTLLNNILYWLILNKYVCPINFNIDELLKHIKPLLLLFIPVIAINIYKYIDKIMLGAILNIGEVGIFEAAEKITNIPIGIITAIGTVMLPRISNMINKKSNKTEVKRYGIISLEIIMFLAIGMTFGLAGISDVFIPLFYGEEFDDSSIVILYLLPCLIFVSWANVIRTQYLLPYKKDSIFCKSVIVGAILNIISNYILIPKFGAVGAAISTLNAEITVCVYQSLIASKDIEIIEPLKGSIKYILIGLVMYLIINNIHLDSSLLCVSLRILCGITIYISLSLIFISKSLNFTKNAF